METLAENWFFVLVILLCIGHHFFHGHGRHDVERHEPSSPGGPNGRTTSPANDSRGEP